MKELPIDIWHYLAVYLDCTSVSALSQISKILNEILSSQVFWNKRFELFFSTDYLLSVEGVDWRKEFIKEFCARKSWKNDKHEHQELAKGLPAVILSRQSCGEVVDIIEQIPNFPKYKIRMYEIKIEKRERERDSDDDYDDDDEETEVDFKYVVPTDKYVTFPSNLL